MNNSDDTAADNEEEESSYEDGVILVTVSEYDRLKQIEARLVGAGADITTLGDVFVVASGAYEQLKRDAAEGVRLTQERTSGDVAIIPRHDHERLVKVEQLALKAINEKGDDLCWRDLYMGLCELLGKPSDPQLLVRSQHLANCVHFIDCLYHGKTYEPPFASAWTATQCEEFWRAVLQWFQSMDTVFRLDGHRGQDPKMLFSVMRCWREAFKLMGVLDRLGLPKVPTTPESPEAG